MAVCLEITMFSEGAKKTDEYIVIFPSANAAFFGLPRPLFSPPLPGLYFRLPTVLIVLQNLKNVTNFVLNYKLPGHNVHHIFPVLTEISPHLWPCMRPQTGPTHLFQNEERIVLQYGHAIWLISYHEREILRKNSAACQHSLVIVVTASSSMTCPSMIPEPLGYSLTLDVGVGNTSEVIRVAGKAETVASLAAVAKSVTFGAAVGSGTTQSNLASKNLGTLKSTDSNKTGTTYFSSRRRHASGLFMAWL